MSAHPKIFAIFSAWPLLALVLFSSAGAQDEKANETQGETQQGWILWIFPHGNAEPHAISAHLTYDDAVRAEKEWFAAHKDSLDLPGIREGQVKVSRKPLQQNRPTEAKSPADEGRRPTIVQPNLGFVDPGAKKPDKAASIAGRSGTGNIGKYKVTITFTGAGDKGEFVVAGGLQGRGKWVQLGPYVQMETDTSKYEGKLQGNELTGTRQRKNEATKDEWAISLQAKADEMESKGSLTYVLPRVSGTYNNESNKGKLIINPNGAFTIYSWTGRKEETGKVTSFDPETKKIRLRYAQGFDLDFQVSDDLSTITEFPFKRAGR